VSVVKSTFTFRLQRVLELREQKEQAIAGALTQAQGEANRAREAHGQLEAVRQAGAERLAAAHVAPGTVGQLQQLGAMLDFIDQHLTVTGTAVTAAEQNVQQVQDQLTAALQERRVLDRLKERHFEAWRTSAAQLDRQLMDDLALQRFIRPDASSSSNQDQ
jgi:flagellar protein FliJ